MSQTMVNLVLIARYAEMCGYSEKAIRRKIERGVWVVGREVVFEPIKRGFWGYCRGMSNDRSSTYAPAYPYAPTDLAPDLVLRLSGGVFEKSDEKSEKDLK